MKRLPSEGRKSIMLIAMFTLVLILVASAGGFMLIMPGRSHKGPLPPLGADEALLRDRLRGHVSVLAEKIGERNISHYRALGLAAEYITSHLRESGLSVRKEPYWIGDKEVANIEAELKGTARPEEIVVVGAHYDTVPGSPGANDNASGVAALLEIVSIFRYARTARTIRFVAFVNEEPPYFMSETMGSLVYARRARNRKDKIVAMLSLETIGYYSDRPKSQLYPAPFSLFYPDTGDFIGFVSDLGSRKLLRRAIGTFRESTHFPSEGLAAPAGIEGVGWSDHWSFWQAGYPAIMITDTALFRYPHYHESSDTPDKLDFERMARVVKGIGGVVGELANSK